MKTSFLKKWVLCSFLVLSSCHSNTKTTSVLPITNTVLSFTNDETLKVDKYVNGSSIFKYQNDSNEWIDFDCLAFGIDFDSLIGGDALIFSHFGTCTINTVLPAHTYISGSITKVDVKHSDIYEVVLHKKNNNTIYFEHLDSSIDIEIGFSFNYQNNFCITQNNGKISLKPFLEYKDGTILYYAYNPVFLNPKDYTWMYDYKPR